MLIVMKIGIAYWAGARFDVSLKGLTIGNIFSVKEKVLDTQQGSVVGGLSIAHGEL
jgi:uncharacterized membrane protein YhfC